MERVLRSFRAVQFLLLGLVLLCLSAARGKFIDGWDFTGIARGVLLIGEKGWITALADFWHSSHHFQYAVPSNGLLYGYLPGALYLLIPWPYWSNVVSLAIFSAGLCLTLRLVESSSARTVVLLGYLGSSSLLSFALVGNTPISGPFIVVLALGLLATPRFAKRGTRTRIEELLSWLLVGQLAFQAYDGAKIVAWIPIAAAFGMRGLLLPRRVMLLLTGILLAIDFFLLRHSQAAEFMPKESFLAVVAAVGPLIERLVSDSRFDPPLVLFASLIALPLLKKDKLFWLLLYVGFIISCLAIASHGLDELRPRRMLIFHHLCVLICALAADQRRAFVPLRLLLFSLFAAGCIWNFARMGEFLRDPRDSTASLPGIWSAADYRIDRPGVQKIMLIIESMQASPGTHFVLYGYSEYQENSTDPLAFPERALLWLGPERFAHEIFFVDEKGAGTCRYVCIPQLNLDDAREKLRQLPHATIHALSLSDGLQGALEKQREFEAFLRQDSLDSKRFTWIAH